MIPGFSLLRPALLSLGCMLVVACERRSPPPLPIQETVMTPSAPQTEERPVRHAVRYRIGETSHFFPLVKEWPVAQRLERPRLTVQRDSREHLELRIPLAAGEAIWGFGQRFDAFNLRGRRLESWTTDGWNADDTSYFATPFYISSSGYGLLVNHPGRIQFDIGAANENEMVIRIPDRGVELILFEGSPATITRAYSDTVGRPAFIPDWIYRPWMSRNSYLGAYEVDRVLGRMRDLGMPIGVVVLEAWAEELHNFKITTHRYPEPEAWIRRLHEQGVRVINWITSSVWEGTLAYREAKARGFLVLNEDGSEHVVRWLENGRKIDFRKPEARTWWRDLHQPAIALGIDGFKTDGGEHMPDPMFHNQHPFYYQQASIDAFRALGREGITFSRSANPACASLGAFWAGDQDAAWSRLKMVIRGGLSAALSGYFWWTHDIGAYTGTPTKELYIRWLQFGAFSPLMQFHGIEAREPWHFDDETIAIARYYFQIRERLLPFLTQWGQEALATGTPILRPLAWHFPDDPAVYNLDDHVMLGPDLIVAPVTDPVDGRGVYLPAGTWIDLWTGESHTGPVRFFQSAALHQIPLFARAERAADYAGLLDGAPPPPPADVHIRLAGKAAANGVVPSVRYWRNQPEPERIVFEVRNPTDRDVAFEFRLMHPENLVVEPAHTPGLVLPPGEAQRLAYSIRPRDPLPPGAYPVRLDARADGQALTSPVVEIVRSPNWHVLGLLDGGVGSIQELDAHDVRLDATYPGKFGTPVGWRPVPVEQQDENGRIDLTSLTGPDGSSSTFLYTQWVTDRPRTVTLKAGFGDCMVVWVNGKMVKVVFGHRNPERDEDVFTAELTEGVNHILVKNSRDLSPPHFYFRMDWEQP
ncbi:MAG TPA: glycoside hydrolase family 31 protein [Kiritimatiellia bacterium]|nr:glycoside hydrolase family 31 protein [Kiritimatiellia bacterium]HMO98061.1 glycoside hydrolase family 31 protein [Kiritimatiellia bacterium]HMP97007.1 glycoside hydrolase family 31 protein [Kiritimatiellia bacterium]